MCLFWWKVKYKEQFSKEMKSHQYNPLDSASFKQAQIASTLASDVSEFALYFTCIYILKNLTFVLKQNFFFHLMITLSSSLCYTVRLYSRYSMLSISFLLLTKLFSKGLQSFS